MDVTTDGIWVAMVVGVALLFWWWNDIWYALTVRLRLGGRTRLPSGYMGIPVFGEMVTFLWYFTVLRRPDDYINSKRSRYGDGVGLYRTHLLGSPALIAWTPSANKFVLQTESSNFSTGWPNMDLVGRNSLVAVEGPSHIRVRNVLLETISRPDSLRTIALMVQPRLTATLHLWAHKGRINVFREAKKVTFANMGKYFASFEPGPILDTLDELFEGLLDGFRAIPINLPGTALHYALKCRKKATEIFREEMEKRKRLGASNAKNDILEGLMRMKDEEGKQLRDIEVLDNIVGIVLAGYISTSSAIMWAFYYLAKYPDVLQKLHEEHLTVMKKLNGNLFTYDDISSCKYTGKVVEEVIRLANISPFSLRVAKKDVEYKGCMIPKGWTVFCWFRYVHTDPQNFEDPLCFNPDRWSKPPKAGTYLAFAAGPRVCPGNMLVRLQMSLLLHHLVVGYRWELVNPNAAMTYLSHPLPADGLEVTICPI